MARKTDERDRPEGARGERIAKAIARAGLASRREAEGWIAAGRVAVNGATIAEPGRTVTPADRITVDGAPLPTRERTRLFLYHKPRGLVTTHADPEGRPTIFAALPKDLPRLLSVGRLDIGTEGLLLLTNDGGLARLLELPQTGWLRRYRVRALGRVTQPDLDRLRDGVTVDGIHYGPVEATLDREQGSNVWLTFAIREGKNREVRNVLGHLGLQVNRLIRISFGPFQLGELAEGAVDEVRTRVLREQLGERVVAEAKCDLSAPIVAREAPEDAAEPPRERDGRRERRGEERRKSRREPDDERRHRRREPARSDKPPGRPRRGHAWRADDAPLRRHYRGGDERRAPADAAGPKRAGLLTDRKGRRVLVERFGDAKPREEPRAHGKKRFDKRPGGRPAKGRNRRRPDRAHGPRPSRPRDR